MFVEKVDPAKVLRLLRAKPTLKYSEIGARVGLTRERVRQIAAFLLVETGAERWAEIRQEKYGPEAPKSTDPKYNRWYYRKFAKTRRRNARKA